MNKSITLLVVAIAVLLFQYCPSDLNFEPKFYDIPFPNFKGPYAPSNVREEFLQVHEGKLPGPEALDIGPDGHIYTGLSNGVIVRLVGEKIEKVTNTGSRDCQGYHGKPMQECGRPLGLRFGKNGILYAVDAYTGLISVDTKTGKVNQLLPLLTAIGGKNLTLPDDLDIDQDENIYFSDGSTKWGLDKLIHLLLERQSDGRIIKYNIRNRKAEVLVDKLVFPNGVQLSRDGASLLICECNLRRIVRYYLKGPKVGKMEIFLDNLPGYPDNIRPSHSGGYWVAVVTPRNETHKLFIDTMMNYPTMIQILVRAHHVIGSILEFIGNKISCNCIKDWAKAVHSLSWVKFDGEGCMVLELDAAGRPIKSFSGPYAQCGDISHVLEHNSQLYLGSFSNNYLTTLKL